ncbi:MAG: DKNYY domain-containing protein [Candidatus Paceibacterota bacterium]|jgi:hypothetical protein
MKKTYIIAVSILMLAGIGIGGYYFAKSRHTVVPTEQNRQNMSAATSSVVAAQNSRISVTGDATTTRGNTENIAEDTEAQTLFSSLYQIKTDGVYVDETLLVGADPTTFKLLGRFNYVGLYAKDKNYVYHDGSIVKDADPNTFGHVGAMYTKDTKHAYFLDETNIDAPPPEVLPEFSDDKIIPNADAKTFSWIKDAFAKDINNVYYVGSIIPNADPKTFQHVDYGYTKDATHVYFAGQLISGADPKTFQYVDNGYAKDATNVYFSGKVILGADPKNCTVKNLYGCK